jgi:putative effector of murein hydrolase
MTDIINQFSGQRGIILETQEIVVHQLIEVAMVIDSYLTTFSLEQVFASILCKNPLLQTAVCIAHLHDGCISYHYYVDDALLSALQAI